MRGVGGPLLTIGDLLSDLAVEGGDGPLVGVGDVSAPSSPAASQQAEKDDPSDLSRLFEVVGEIQSSLDRVRRRLSSTSTRHLLQGPLLKRSDTLRKWNERWVILDPTTWKIEYKVRRSDKDVRGVILFDSTSTVTLSPMNFHGLAKYDGCCFYIGTPQKKEYFLCAETPSAARAWVSTLQ